MHPLDGVEIKMNRSQEHITALRDESSEFVRSHGAKYRIVRDLAPPTGWSFYVDWEPVPGRFGAIIGDALTNMRAALDHLATQLHLATNPSPVLARVNFPILLKQAPPNEWAKAMSRFSPVARPIIEAVQPYQNIAKGRLAEVHPVGVLNTLVNRDKHEALTVTEMFGSESVIRITSPDDGSILAMVETPGGVASDPVGFLPDTAFPPDEPYGVFATIAPILAIDVGDTVMHPILELLVGIHRYVMDDVIVPLAVFI